MSLFTALGAQRIPAPFGAGKYYLTFGLTQSPKGLDFMRIRVYAIKQLTFLK